MLNVLYVPLRNNIICQDFYLDEPERIIEQLPIFFFYPRSAQAYLYTRISAIEFDVRKMGYM